MRHAAILLMLLGCSAGPSVVSDPPPVPIVVEPAEAPKPLPDADGVTIVAEIPADDTETLAPLPFPTPRPDSFQAIVAEAVRRANEADASRQESLDSCQCGESCDCVDCQCPDCPHAKVATDAPVLVRPHTLFFSAPWCGPCKPAKESLAEVFSGPSGDVYGRCLTFVDADTSPRRMAYYGVTALPAYVLVVDMKVVDRHYGPMTAGQYRQFVNENTRPRGEKSSDDDSSTTASDLSLSFIRVRSSSGGLTHGGSGVVIGGGPGQWLVLTNSHVVRDGVRRPGVEAEFRGEWSPASIVADAAPPRSDLALLSVKSDSRMVAVPVADRPAPVGSNVETRGYAMGEWTPRTTRVIRSGDSWIDTSFPFISGESGGAMVSGGRLVGLVASRDPGGRFGGGVSLKAIREFLGSQGAL